MKYSYMLNGKKYFVVFDSEKEKELFEARYGVYLEKC